MHIETHYYFCFNSSFCQIFIFPSSCEGKHINVYLTPKKKTATFNLRQSVYSCISSPTEVWGVLRSVCVCVCSPGSEEGSVSLLAQSVCHRELSWQGLSRMALLDFRTALCIHVKSQVLRFILRPAWTHFQWTFWMKNCIGGSKNDFHA